MDLPLEVILESQLLILEFEGDRKCEVASHSHTVVLTGLPFGHSLYDTECLAVEVLVNTFGDGGCSDRTVFLNDELHNHTALDIVLLCRFRVTDIVAEPFQEGCLTTGEFGLLLNRHENLIFLMFNNRVLLQPPVPERP